MTASWRSRTELVHQIVTLARNGLSGRTVTSAVGVSRNTVKAVLAGIGSEEMPSTSRSSLAPLVRRVLPSSTRSSRASRS